MPNWKKLVVSGSDARLNSLFTDGPITGSSFSGDGSGLTNIQSSSFATQALTASFALNAGGGTGVGFPFSGSAVITGSLQVDEFASSPLLVQPNSLSSDVVVPDSSSGLLFGDTSISGSLTIPVSSKLFYLNLDAIAYTSSQIQSALTASYLEGSANSANTAISASFATSALTASYALNASSGGSGFPFSGSAVITGSLLVSGSVNFTSASLEGLSVGSTSTQQFTTPSTTWEFVHNLGSRFVNVQTFDDSFNQIIPETLVLSSTSSSIATFNETQTGYMVASVGGAPVAGILPSYLQQLTLTPTSAISSSYSDFALSASYAVSSSHEITLEVSSSFADTSISSSYSLSSSLATSSSISETVTNQNSNSGSLSFWQGSQSEYNAISASADPNTIYFVV